MLPDGVRSRDDVEILIRLEASVRRYDRAFAGWLVANVVDYAVWGERPTGVVTDAIAAWLAGLLDADRPVLARIAREIARETQEVGGTLEEVVSQDAGMEAAMAAAQVGGGEARV